MTSKEDFKKPHPYQRFIDEASAQLLKPCPVCGGKQELLQEYMVNCPNESCRIERGRRARITIFGEE